MPRRCAISAAPGPPLARPRSASMRRPPLRPLPRRSSLKQSRRPPAEFFSPPCTVRPPPRRPPHRFPTTGAPPPRRTPSEHHRHSPPSGERPSELLHPPIDLRLLTPGSPSSCRTHPPSSTTTGATPLPSNTAAQHRLRRLTVGPPLQCAPAPSSLPGTYPVVPSRSLATPCRRLATGEHATAPSRAQSARGDQAGARALPRAAQAVFTRWAEPPGCGLVAVSAGRAWQAAGPSTAATGRISARALLKSFSFSALVK
jgi:hypothetical protein